MLKTRIINQNENHAAKNKGMEKKKKSIDSYSEVFLKSTKEAKLFSYHYWSSKNCFLLYILQYI